MVYDNSAATPQTHRSISTCGDSLVGIEIIDDGIGQMIISHDFHSMPSNVVSSSESQRTTGGNITLKHSQRPRNSSVQSQNTKQKQNRLSWRSDPNASFSDWTIEVATVEGNHITSSDFYHCHSNVLVWGPRKCGEFVKLFQDRMNRMPYSNITQIKLSPSEAAIFPSLLDFLYCETTLSLSAEKICSMFALAEKFDNEMLMIAIQTFVEKYLDLEQSIEFLSYTRRRHHHHDKFEKLVLSTYSKICAYLVKHPKDASKVPPEMLAHILHRRAQVMKVLKGEDPRKFSGEWETNRSRVLSTVVSACCLYAVTSATATSTLSRQTFKRLTDPKHLPTLHSHAALQMLLVDSLLNREEDREDGSHRPDQESLSSLEYRSVKALVTDWRNLFADNQESAFKDVLPNIRSRVLSEILIQVSWQYERKIGATETPRNHEILGNLQLNAFKNRRSSTLQSNDDDSREHQKTQSTFGKGHSCVQIGAQENLSEEEWNEDDWLSPPNRYSIDPDQRPF